MRRQFVALAAATAAIGELKAAPLDRRVLATRHNPVLTAPNPHAPLCAPSQ